MCVLVHAPMLTGSVPCVCAGVSLGRHGNESPPPNSEQSIQGRRRLTGVSYAKRKAFPIAFPVGAFFLWLSVPPVKPTSDGSPRLLLGPLYT